MSIITYRIKGHLILTSGLLLMLISTVMSRLLARKTIYTDNFWQKHIVYIEDPIFVLPLLLGGLLVASSAYFYLKPYASNPDEFLEEDDDEFFN